MKLRHIIATAILVFALSSFGWWRYCERSTKHHEGLKVISVTDSTGITYSVVYCCQGVRGEVISRYQATTDDNIIEVWVYEKPKK